MAELIATEWFRVPMVERVARDLARHQVMSNLRLDAARGEPPLPPERIEAAIGHAWINYATEARVAIAAMREPNLAMRKAVSFSEAEITWPAMIDAALADGKAPKTEGEA
jgi:hypothetical protein